MRKQESNLGVSLQGEQTKSIIEDINEATSAITEPLIPKKRKFDQPLFCLCVTNFLLNAAVSIITPFYPPLAKDVGMSVSMISYVFSINPVGSFMFSIFMGSKMSVWGRKKCLMIGLISQVLTIIIFGLLELMKDNYALFLSVSLFTRFIQGMSRAAYSSLSFAYIPILWPSSIQQKISILESLTGLGLMAGPFIGALLFRYLKYQATFYVMGGLFSITLIPILLFIPEDYRETKKEITFKSGKVMRGQNIILLSLIVLMTSAGTTYINPLFSIHMQTYGINSSNSSLLLGSLTIAYILSILFVPSLCKILNKSYVIVIGSIIACIGDLIIAPVQFIPNQWWIVLIGLPLIGIANSLCVLPSIPLYIEFMQEIIPQIEHKRSISDLSSALFVSSYSLGIFVGPLVGGQVYQFFIKDDTIQHQQRAFKWASMVISALQLFIAMLFFIFAVLTKKQTSSSQKISEVVDDDVYQQVNQSTSENNGTNSVVDLQINEQ